MHVGAELGEGAGELGVAPRREHQHDAVDPERLELGDMVDEPGDAS